MLARVISVALPAYFLLHSAAMVAYFVVRGLVGVDARIYAAASRAWVEGGNPWTTVVDGYYFAAPPPTLVPFVPFSFLGESISSVLWVGGTALVALWVVRRLGLSWWWAFFPPVTNSVLAGNPDIVIVGLILTRSHLLATLGTFFKIYALVPIIGERRWRALAISTAALIVTVPLLPWEMYLSQIGHVVSALDAQAIGISAYGAPWLMVGAALALAAVGPRMAGWLAVPALWPSTQLHYSALALPALAQARNHKLAFLVAAAMLSPEIVWLPPLAVVLIAIAATWARIRRKRAQRPTVAPVTVARPIPIGGPSREPAPFAIQLDMGSEQAFSEIRLDDGRAGRDHKRLA